MRFSAIRYARDGCVASITLLRSQCVPTIDEATASDLRECCQALMFEDDLRVVTISGRGNEFATGRTKPPREMRNAHASGRHAWQDAISVASAVAALPMPVIAVINGDATAHGLELALAADLRIATDDARFAIGDPRSDGFPYDGGTQRLPRLVGPALARDMLLTGRMLSAAEALEAGLVNRVAPAGKLDAAVAELVSQIIASAPIAARYAKEAVAAAGDLTLTQGLRLEADLSITLQSTEDRAEGLRSFAEKRQPKFQGH